MKKIFKCISGIILFAVVVFSIIKIIQLIKKYSLWEVLLGIGKLSSDGADVVELSENGTKFLTFKNEEGLSAFKEYLETVGYRYIGQFGSSNLYEYEGIEVVIKRSNLFGKYYLFEIFNEKYFEETGEYLTV